MSLSNQSSASYPDELTPATMRRLQLWRALTDLSKAQADGQLSADQARLLEALADNLQRVATHLTQLADLGRQYAQALEPLLDSQTGRAGLTGSASPAPTSGATVQDVATPRPPVER